MHTMTFRSADPVDWPAVEALLRASALPLDGARDHLADFTLAEAGGALAACAAVERYGDAGLLRSVAVDPTHRGTGLGQSLTRHVIAAARAAGLRELVLMTTTAESFFPKFGFTPIARGAAPEAILASVQFQIVRCASATVMRLAL